MKKLTSDKLKRKRLKNNMKKYENYEFVITDDKGKNRHFIIFTN
jgi:hypothetical protein